jgi:hypothetical protein
MTSNIFPTVPAHGAPGAQAVRVSC